MTRRNEDGRTLGGIGTMLAQSDACPACGKVHTSRLIRYLPATARMLPGVRSSFSLIGESVPIAPGAPRNRRFSSLSVPIAIPRYSEESR